MSPAPSVSVSASHARVSRDSDFLRGRARGRGTFASYVWAFGDGSTSNGANVTHSYAKAGYFEAAVTVTDGNGVTAVGSTAVNVSNLSITARCEPNAGRTCHGFPLHGLGVWRGWLAFHLRLEVR